MGYEFCVNVMDEAVLRNDTESVKLLLNHRSDYHFFRNAPLVIASTMGNIDMVRLLLNDNRTESTVQGALYIAARYGYLDIAELLLKYQTSDILHVNLALVVINEDIDMLRLLLNDSCCNVSEDNNRCLKYLARCKDNNMASEMIAMFLRHPNIKLTEEERVIYESMLGG